MPYPRLAKRTITPPNTTGPPSTNLDQIESAKDPENTGRSLGDAALWYAKRGFHVFPLHGVDDAGRCSCGGKSRCKPGKHPRLSNGHHGATTDPGQIRRRWTRWPDANIGIATGERSGLLVLDVDADGFTSLVALEGEHGSLPPTLTVATGSGGRHVYLKYPTGISVRNSAGKVGRGLDVRGEGGYVVAPPSRTDKGRYTVLDKKPLAQPPAWLLEAARGPHRAGRDNDEAGSMIMPPADREPIPFGQRGDALFRIACSLRAKGAEYDRILSEIRNVNRERCSPPIGEHPDDTDPGELEQIAENVVARYLAGDASPEPDSETLARVEALFTEVLDRLHWTGRSGPTDRAVYVALLITARRYGQPSINGIKVYISVRALALAAGVSKKTVWKALDRLRAQGLVYRPPGRSGIKAGALILKLPQEVVTQPGDLEVADSDLLLRGVVGELLRLRWGAGRVGKLRALLLEVIARVGEATLADLAERTGRRRDNVSRALRLLEARALVECSGETYRLVPEFAAALDAELEASGIKLSERLDEQRYRRQQQAFREAWEAGAVTKSRHREFSQEWEVRNPKPEADGFIEDLQRVEGGLAVEGGHDSGRAHDADHAHAAEHAAPTGVVIADATDPEQFRRLTTMVREHLAEHRRKHPPAKLSSTERAARLLRRLRYEDPDLLAALRPDPMRLGRTPWRLGWTGAVFPANTVRAALALLEAEDAEREISEKVA